MSIETTFGIIKPNAVKKNAIKWYSENKEKI